MLAGYARGSITLNLLCALFIFINTIVRDRMLGQMDFCPPNESIPLLFKKDARLSAVLLLILWVCIYSILLIMCFFLQMHHKQPYTLPTLQGEEIHALSFLPDRSTVFKSLLNLWEAMSTMPACLQSGLGLEKVRISQIWRFWITLIQGDNCFKGTGHRATGRLLG